MHKEEIEKLVSERYLRAELNDMLTHRMEVLLGRMDSLARGEPILSGEKLDDLLTKLEEMGPDRLSPSLYLVMDELAASIAELFAANNRRLLQVLGKHEP